MKKKKSDEIRLLHIIDAINFIEIFSSGKTKEDIYTDHMYRFSVERQLEIIGEAANNLSPELQLSCAFVPWPKIISFRNFLAHEYFGVDLELIWGIIDNHIPVLRRNIEIILKDFISPSY